MEPFPMPEGPLKRTHDPLADLLGMQNPEIIHIM